MGCEQQLKAKLYKMENDKTVHWRKNENETEIENNIKIINISDDSKILKLLNFISFKSMEAEKTFFSLIM